MNKVKLTLALVLSIMLAPAQQINAADEITAAAELHRQITVQDHPTGSVYVDNGIAKEDVLAALTAIDDMDNLYDGAMSIYRTPQFTILLTENGNLQIELKQHYSIKESEQTLDEMVSEIDKTLPENASQKEKLNAIISFISKNFKYDYDSKKTQGKSQNYIQAYHGNGRILCDQYAAVTYLLCSRYGIDCRIVEGHDHLFNAIRLNGQNEYTAYDLTKTSQYMPAKVGYVDQILDLYKVSEKSDKYEKAVAKVINVPYRLSFTWPDALMAVTAIAFIATVYLRVKRAVKRMHKKYIVNRCHSRPYCYR